jgi:hypothetical protein
VATTILSGRPGISLSGVAFLGLRGMSALGAVVNGFALTYGFSRALEPSIFVVFMWIGNLGISLWLFDLGLARVLYRNIRAKYLSKSLGSDPSLSTQATALVALYTTLVLLGALAAFIVGRATGWGASFAMFFAFSALNLPWHVLRQISAGVDCFVTFELLEFMRRVTHIGLIVSIPFGLSVSQCLIAGNATWLILLVVAMTLLTQRGGLGWGTPLKMSQELYFFLKGNRREILWSSGYVSGELFNYTYPPLIVPLVYGLGEIAIAFDTAYKIFRGTNVLLAAACEVATPWQTRAHAAGDRRGIFVATAAAAMLSFFPAAGVCGLLIFADNALFRLLLGQVATVPHSLALLMATLVAANWLQTVANSVLLYNGYFRAIGLLALTMAALLCLPILYLLSRPDVVHFTAAYAFIYLGGALAYAVLAMRLPLRNRQAVL